MVNTSLARVAAFVSLFILLPWSAATMAYSAQGNTSVRICCGPATYNTWGIWPGPHTATSTQSYAKGFTTATSSEIGYAGLGVSAAAAGISGSSLLTGLASGHNGNLLYVPSPEDSSETTVNATFQLRISGDLNVSEKSPDEQLSWVTSRVGFNVGFAVDPADITLQARFDGDDREVLTVAPGYFRVEKAEDDKFRLPYCDAPETAEADCFVEAGFSFTTGADNKFTIDFTFASDQANYQNNLVFDLLVPGVLDLDRTITVNTDIGVQTRVAASAACYDCPSAAASFASGLSYALSTESSYVIPEWSSEATVGAPQIAPLAAVPLPPAVWLFGSGLLGLAGMARRKSAWPPD